ncbi:uncharacterized protein KY384_008052 [Bacidia gigantensis]|uniref:uncharacterized protein n=1 Tax=Bacidia gigantensis TaxID=2732470 RepID=UPI001D04686E|nr:uncharacterized protein KY384_008052 [Bacidia gigantensis]KAG8527308.1 hypothetical protein KY384_008052 [Bacidia gigantensis]
MDGCLDSRRDFAPSEVLKCLQFILQPAAILALHQITIKSENPLNEEQKDALKALHMVSLMIPVGQEKSHTTAADDQEALGEYLRIAKIQIEQETELVLQEMIAKQQQTKEKQRAAKERNRVKRKADAEGSREDSETEEEQDETESHAGSRKRPKTTTAGDEPSSQPPNPRAPNPVNKNTDTTTRKTRKSTRPVGEGGGSTNKTLDHPPTPPNTPQTKPRGRPPARPKNTTTKPPPINEQSPIWRTVRQLDDLKLHHSLKSMLNADDLSPSLLLEGQNEPELTILPRGDQEATGPNSLEEGIMRCFMYALTSQSKGIYGRMRELFVTLFLGDYADQEFGKTGHINQAKAKRMVKKLIQAHDKAGADDQGPLPDGMKVSELEEKLVDQMPKMRVRGRVLVHLCYIFGTGCLFWLQDVLTENFLNRNAPLSGQYYDAAMIHLLDLKLATTAEDSKGNEIGDAVRAKLAQVFGVKKVSHDKGTRSQPN